ncbi:MAG TPA: hypothetical protein VFO31_21525 [Vicinamibacterales bacterium]|nr:hypothetical protein [Vicinamibacterales bacterium]
MQQQRYAVAVDAGHPERFGRIRQLRESYEEWHRLGIAAFQRGDLASFSDAIDAESALIREHSRVIDELKRRLRPS